MLDNNIFQFDMGGLNYYLEKNAGIITEDWLHAAIPLMMTKSRVYAKRKTKHLFDQAARFGYVRIFTDHATGAFKNLWNSQTLLAAVGGGHLDLLKWLRSKKPNCPWLKGTCQHAASNGHWDVLKWLRSQNPPCHWGPGICEQTASKGRLDMLEWLRSQDPPCPWDENACKIAFYMVTWTCSSG